MAKPQRDDARAKRERLLIADYDVQDIRSVQAFVRFAASADRPPEEGVPPPEFSNYDAKRVLAWLHTASMTYENPTLIALLLGDPSGDMPAFIDGKRSVGQQLNKLAVLKASAFERGPRNEAGIGPQGEQG
jgi:hypothetical protein